MSDTNESHPMTSAPVLTPGAVYELEGWRLNRLRDLTTVPGVEASALAESIRSVVAHAVPTGDAIDRAGYRAAEAEAAPPIGVVPGEVYLAVMTNRVEFLQAFEDRVAKGHQLTQEEVLGVVRLAREAYTIKGETNDDIRELAIALRGATDNLLGAFNVIERVSDGAMALTEGRRPEFRSENAKRQDRKREAANA